MKYNTYTLDNGLRIIHLPAKSEVVYCGFHINVGAASETKGEEGIAHFCEHVTFKGTHKRSSLEIIKCLESVGGDLNAYTTKTTTVYHSAILKQHIERTIDLLSDIVFNSIYPKAEIEKEIEVICDEIASYNDSPAELIYDEFENIIFKGYSIGHSILGTEESVRRFSSEAAKAFTKKYYRPENATFFIYGDVDFQRAINQLASATAHFEPIEQPCRTFTEDATFHYEQPLAYTPTHLVRNKQTHQAHVMIGNIAYAVHDPRRIVLYLLNNILGGPAMSARLNLSLREKYGLVYTVESYMAAYSATGIWGVYFGCDPKDVTQCIDLVRKELDTLMQQPLSDEELQSAKQQIKGQIGIANDNRESFALGFGQSYLHYGWKRDIKKLYQQIDAVTADQLKAVAQDLFKADKVSTLIYQ